MKKTVILTIASALILALLLPISSFANDNLRSEEGTVITRESDPDLFDYTGTIEETEDGWHLKTGNEGYVYFYPEEVSNHFIVEADFTDITVPGDNSCAGFSIADTHGTYYLYIGAIWEKSDGTSAFGITKDADWWGHFIPYTIDFSTDDGTTRTAHMTVEFIRHENGDVTMIETVNGATLTIFDENNEGNIYDTYENDDGSVTVKESKGPTYEGQFISLDQKNTNAFIKNFRYIDLDVHAAEVTDKPEETSDVPATDPPKNPTTNNPETTDKAPETVTQPKTEEKTNNVKIVPIIAASVIAAAVIAVVVVIIVKKKKH